MTYKVMESTSSAILNEQAGCSLSTSCLVCGRISNTGHHYGVTACLGCKTFFRRVVLQGTSPKCKYANACRLEKSVHAKRLCRSCRYLKCLEIGMKEEALHPCRDVIGRRHRSSESTPVSSPPSIFSSLNNIFARSPAAATAAEEDLQFLTSIRDMDTEIRTRTAHILGKPANGEKQIHFYSPNQEYTNVSVNNELGPSLKVDITLLREWVNRVPCFSELNPRYKKHLMRRFCLRYTVIEHGLFTAQMPRHEHVWFLSDRTCLVREFVNIPEEIRCHLTPAIVEEQKLLAPFTTMLIHEVADPLRHLSLSSMEVAAVKVLMLLKPTCLREFSGDDIASSDDLEQIRRVRNRVLNGLHAHYVREGTDNVAARFGEVLMLSGGVEVCADRALEEMHLLRVFNLSSFDQDSQDVIFGFSKTF